MNNEYTSGTGVKFVIYLRLEMGQQYRLLAHLR
jgi:hypothetical protein